MDSIYPTKGSILVGTWTTTDIKAATQKNYKILHCQKASIWEETTNPLTTIYAELYSKRKQAQTEYDNWYYKTIMNQGIGKLGQYKNNREYIVDKTGNAAQLAKQGWEPTKNTAKHEETKTSPTRY